MAYTHARTHTLTVTYRLNVHYSAVNSSLILYAGKSLYLFPRGDTFKPEEPLTRSEDRRE